MRASRYGLVFGVVEVDVLGVVVLVPVGDEVVDDVVVVVLADCVSMQIGCAYCVDGSDEATGSVVE